MQYPIMDVHQSPQLPNLPASTEDTSLGHGSPDADAPTPQLKGEALNHDSLKSRMNNLAKCQQYKKMISH
jgi:hypothetical protein